MDRSNIFFFIYKCITANASAIWQHAAHEKYRRIFRKKFRGKDQQAEKDKIERVTGLGRRTRDKIEKWNQMTALRFQTGGRRTKRCKGKSH